MQVLVGSLGFGLITASILAFGTLAFTLQFGMANIFNLAFGDIMTASALAGYEVHAVTGSIWLAIAGGALAGAAVSLVIQRGLIRPLLKRGTRPFSLVVVTLAAGIIIQNGLTAIGGANYFTLRVTSLPALSLDGVAITQAQLAIFGFGALTMIAVHLLLSRSRIGKAMRATASEPELAQSCGIPTGRVVTAVWTASGALCGITGMLLVINTSTFQATTGASFAVIIIAAAVFGGIGDPYGAMLGALVLGLVTELIASWYPSYKDVSAFVVLAVVLLVRPRGLRGILRDTQEMAL
jgi:branched-subunit amino acid ABC-type transport system permease component